MFRRGMLISNYLRDENGKILRHYDNTARQATDHNGLPEYCFRFSSEIDLDVKFNGNFKSVTDQGFSNGVIDNYFDEMVKAFALELAKTMKYKNYKNLSRHGIPPEFVLWDKESQ